MPVIKPHAVEGTKAPKCEWFPESHTAVRLGLKLPTVIPEMTLWKMKLCDVLRELSPKSGC